MKEYTHKELMEMQERALLRAKEMQARATRAVSGEGEFSRPVPERERSEPARYPDFEKPPGQRLRFNVIEEIHEGTHREERREEERHSDEHRDEYHRDRGREERRDSHRQEEHHREERRREKHRGEEHRGLNPLSSIGDMFGGLLKDKDKLLLIGMIIMLSSEGADQLLILAMIYILL